MIYVQIVNSVVANRAIFDSPMPNGWVTDGTLWIANEQAQIGWGYVNGQFVPPTPLPPPPTLITFFSRDFMTQLTATDYTAIQSTIAQSASLGLLWSSMLAQGDAPIDTASARFKAGWTGVQQALGTTRATQIATALGFVG